MTSRPIVVLDPGHGGDGPVGASSPNRGVGPNGLKEKDVALDLARRTRDRLSPYATVLMTREDDHNLSLADRAAAARNVGADAFVSVHLSGADDPTTDATDVVIGRSAGPGSATLAGEIQRRLSMVTGAPGAVRQADLGQIATSRHDPRTRACLVEVADLTNASQAARLSATSYLDQLADALADAIRTTTPGPGTLPMTPGRSAGLASGMSVQDVADQIVASGEATPDEVQAFLSTFRPPTSSTSSVTHAFDTVQLPAGVVLDGWRAVAFNAVLQTVLSLVPGGSFLSVDLLLTLADEVGCTIMVGPAGSLAAGVGVTGSFGLVFAPGRRLGFYGSSGAVGGWSIAADVTVRVTVLKGGPEHLGSSVTLSVSGGEEISGGVTLLLNPGTGAVEGLALELGVGVGLTPLRGVIGRDLTATTFSAAAYSRPFSAVRAFTVQEVADQIVASGEANPDEVRAFLATFQPATAATTSYVQGLSTATIPTGEVLSGWKTRLVLSVFGGAVPLVGLLADGLLDLADETNCTVLAGPALSGTAVVGITGGAGLVFAPGHRIGVYGSFDLHAGLSLGVEATIRLAVIKGGPEHLGDSVLISAGVGEGLVANATIMLNTSTQEVEGFAVDIGVGVGLTPIRLLMGREHLTTSFSTPAPLVHAMNPEAAVAAADLGWQVAKEIFVDPKGLTWSRSSMDGTRLPGGDAAKQALARGPYQERAIQSHHTIAFGGWPTDNVGADVSIRFNYNGHCIQTISLAVTSFAKPDFDHGFSLDTNIRPAPSYETEDLAAMEVEITRQFTSFRHTTTHVQHYVVFGDGREPVLTEEGS